MMFSTRRAGALAVISAAGVLAGTACGSGNGQPAPAQAATQSAPAQPAGQQGRFSAPTRVDNRMFPLVAGTQFVYQGTVSEGGKPSQHGVVFTVTDLTKKIHGVTTVVAWDRDFRDGRLQEQELAFFAQDDAGNVWNFGEYPEEYENGKFTGAPSTWIRGSNRAYGGIHMLAKPAAGAQYREGLVPPIEFNDMSRVARTGQKTCMGSRCFRHVLVVDEWSPNDPSSGHQIKYYSPGVGLVRVAARGGDSQEFLTLSRVQHLSSAAMAGIRSQALAAEHRAYHVSKVYRGTEPATQGG
jgi:hypothetical protein